MGKNSQSVKQKVKQIAYLAGNGEIIHSTGKKLGVNVAGARGSRTHRGHRRVPTNGFEVREHHRAPTAPIIWHILQRQLAQANREPSLFPFLAQP